MLLSYGFIFVHAIIFCVCIAYFALYFAYIANVFVAFRLEGARIQSAPFALYARLSHALAANMGESIRVTVNVANDRLPIVGTKVVRGLANQVLKFIRKQFTSLKGSSFIAAAELPETVEMPMFVRPDKGQFGEFDFQKMFRFSWVDLLAFGLGNDKADALAVPVTQCFVGPTNGGVSWHMNIGKKAESWHFVFVREDGSRLYVSPTLSGSVKVEIDKAPDRKRENKLVGVEGTEFLYGGMENQYWQQQVLKEITFGVAGLKIQVVDVCAEPDFQYILDALVVTAQKLNVLLPVTHSLAPKNRAAVASTETAEGTSARGATPDGAPPPPLLAPALAAPPPSTAPTNNNGDRAHAFAAGASGGSWEGDADWWRSGWNSSHQRGNWNWWNQTSWGQSDRWNNEENDGGNNAASSSSAPAGSRHSQTRSWQ